MARSHVIWLAWNHETGPVRAFTVKHELATWLNSNSEPYCRRLSILRMRDGYAWPDEETTSHDSDEIIEWGKKWNKKLAES